MFWFCILGLERFGLGVWVWKSWFGCVGNASLFLELWLEMFGLEALVGELWLESLVLLTLILEL